MAAPIQATQPAPATSQERAGIDFRDAMNGEVSSTSAQAGQLNSAPSPTLPCGLDAFSPCPRRPQPASFEASHRPDASKTHCGVHPTRPVELMNTAHAPATPPRFRRTRTAAGLFAFVIPVACGLVFWHAGFAALRAGPLPADHAARMTRGLETFQSNPRCWRALRPLPRG
jgi:hypothetical protein